MIPVLALLFLGYASAADFDDFDSPGIQASACSSTGTFTYTYGGHAAETDFIDVDGVHHDKTHAAVDPTTTTVTGCPWETHRSDNDDRNDDDNDHDDFFNRGTMTMDMGDMDHMLSPGRYTITRTAGPATTFTTSMTVEEVSDSSSWTSTVVQTIVVVTGTASSDGAAATTSAGGNGNSATRWGDLAGFKAVSGGLAVALLVLAAM